jgi:hypothetical protein
LEWASGAFPQKYRVIFLKMHYYPLLKKGINPLLIADGPTVLPEQRGMN